MFCLNLFRKKNEKKLKKLFHKAFPSKFLNELNEIMNDNGVCRAALASPGSVNHSTMKGIPLMSVLGLTIFYSEIHFTGRNYAHKVI